MAKKKKKEMTDLSVGELQSMEQVLAREVFDLRNELALSRKLEKPHLLKEKRRQRARTLTILTQKQQKGAAL
jgi:large subunit ribosomal protein L29